MKKILGVMLMLFSNISLAAVVQDGVISRVYVSGSSFAITLKDPLSTTFQANCSSANGFIGASGMATATTNPSGQLAAILSAQARGALVSVVAEGCLGGWYQLKDLYINN
jgi:hypothetical protein